MRNPVAAIPVRAGRVGALQVAAERFGPGPLNPWQENYYVAEDGRVVTQYTSSRVSDVWLPDNEGVLRAIPGGVPAASGLRVVENLVQSSDDFDNAAWTKVGTTTITANVAVAPDGSMTADRVNNLIDAAGDRLAQTLGVGNIEGRLFDGTLWFRGEGSDIGKTIRFFIKRQTGSSSGGTRTVTLTAEWQRLSTGTLTGLATGNNVTIGLNSAPSTATSALIWRGFLQEVTGASNQNPGEDQKTSATDNGFAYYATELANTVDGSGVVTEAVGAAITGWKWEHVPAATNKQVNYNLNPTDLTSVTEDTPASGVLSLVTVTLPAELQAAGNGSVFQSVNTSDGDIAIGGSPGNTNQHSFTIWAVKTAGSGASTVGLGSGQIGAQTILGTWTKHTLEDITPSSAGNLFKVAVKAGDTVQFIGNQMEETTFVTPIIEVSGSTASRDIEEPRKTLTLGTNFNQREGTLIIDGWVPGTDAVDTGANVNVVGVQDANSLFFINGAATIIKTTDGTNTPNQTLSWVAGNKYRFMLRYRDLEMQLGYQDVTGGGAWQFDTVATYDGAFTVNEWVIGYANAFPFTYENIEYFHTDLGTDKVEQLYP